MTSNLKCSLRSLRLGLVLIFTLFMAVASWATSGSLTTASVKYIDENGEEKSVIDYTVLTSTTDVSNLPGGWYVVQGKVSYTRQVTFSGDAYLILADGAKMEIEPEDDEEYGIYALKNLSIYGQSYQYGILKVSAIYGYSGINGNGNITISGGRVAATSVYGIGINGNGNITIRGGIVTATSENNHGINSNGNITIRGGIVTATSENNHGINGNGNITIRGGDITATSEKEDGIYGYNDVTISGGDVTVTGQKGYGIYAYNGNIILSWTNSTDAVKASRYHLGNSEKHVVVVDGKSIANEGEEYSGTLNDEQLSRMERSTLTPVLPAPIKYVDDRNEKTISDYSVLTSTTDVSNLPGGWYVVQGEVSYTSQVTFDDDVYLILADGAKLEIETDGKSEHGINTDGNLTIYGQRGQSGILKATAKGSDGSGIRSSENVTINGGDVTATGVADGINSYNGVMVNGGRVTATSEHGAGIYTYNGNIVLSWTNLIDKIKANRYYSGTGSVVITEGKSFTDEDGYVYSGTFNDEQLSAIKGKTLTPVPPAPVKYIDDNGEEKSVVDYTVLTSTIDVKNLLGGWYVVQGEVSYRSGISFTGDVYLILADGAKMEVKTYHNSEHGINIDGNLTIYGQSAQSGILEATANWDYSYGIRASEGDITISGGNVTASGTSSKGYGISGRYITVNRGNVVALGRYCGISGGKVTINGGSVWASGDQESIYSGDNLTINGGTVDGRNGKILSYGNITINGGDVTAIGKYSYISNRGNLTIRGGSVTVSKISSDDVSVSGGIVTVSGDIGILVDNITISGGIVAVSGDGSIGILASSKGNITISGGDVTVTSKTEGFYTSEGNITISGGNVTATGRDYGINGGNVTISGGNVSASGRDYGIRASKGDITLSWTSLIDNIKSNGDVFANGNVIIADGKAFMDEDGNVYSGTLNDEQRSAVKGKTLSPCYAVTFEPQNGKAPVMLPAIFDEKGIAHVAKPDDPTPMGYIFVGWYTTENVDAEFDFTAAVTGNTTVYAKWQEKDPIEIVDENGKPQYITGYTVLTSDIATPDENGVINLPSGWYVAMGTVDMAGIVFEGNANLVLMDGAELNVENESGNAIEARENLTIYGQSGQSGILVASGNDNGIISEGNVEIVGGSVTVSGGENGKGITSKGKISIGWANLTDRINVSSFYPDGDKSEVVVLDGKYFKDESGNVYSGKLNEDQIKSIEGKALVPFVPKQLSDVNIVVAYIPVQNYNDGEPVCPESVVLTEGKVTLKAGTDYTFACFNNTGISSATLDGAAYVEITGKGNYAGVIEKRFNIWKNLGDYAAVQIFEDENGKKHAVIDGEYEGEKTVDIPNEIAVDAVDYIRNFDANTPSTVLMPVRLPSCATVNAKFYKLDEVYQSGYRWVAKVQNIGKALPQANTAYAVMLPTAGKLEFNFEGCATAEEKQAIVQTGEIQTSGNTDGSWYFTGTYAFKRWTETENKDEVGLVYGFAGSNEEGIAKGQFGRVDFGAHANPLRCYLRKKDKSVVLKTQTQMLAKAAPQVLKAAPYSISLLPETIDVEFVDDDENGEHTTAIGRMETRTGKIRLLRTDRTYDLKGRRVNDVKRAAKGAYYGKKF